VDPAFRKNDAFVCGALDEPASQDFSGDPPSEDRSQKEKSKAFALPELPFGILTLGFLMPSPVGRARVLFLPKLGPQPLTFESQKL
jgi:hypothetical protein